MPTFKRMICLANSRKLSGRCIAGREWLQEGIGDWIRPVSDRSTEEVSEHERQYEDGSDPRVLDVIDVPVLEARPHACQSENWLLDPNYHWSRAGTFERSDLDACAECPAVLWVNGHHTYNGLNDEVPEAAAREMYRSLYFIKTAAVELRVFAPGAAFGNPKRRVQARFSHGNADYAFFVTDPLVERKYLAQGNGDYALGASHVTVSLSEPLEKRSTGALCRYKLVAAII